VRKIYTANGDRLINKQGTFTNFNLKHNSQRVVFINEKDNVQFTSECIHYPHNN